jgi:hypothetical protein
MGGHVVSMADVWAGRWRLRRVDAVTGVIFAVIAVTGVIPAVIAVTGAIFAVIAVIDQLQ